jgi:hypothetical protein
VGSVLAGWQIDDDINRLARLEAKAGRLFKMKRHCAFGDFFTSFKFYLISIHLISPGTRRRSAIGIRELLCLGISGIIQK